MVQSLYDSGIRPKIGEFDIPIAPWLVRLLYLEWSWWSWALNEWKKHYKVVPYGSYENVNVNQIRLRFGKILVPYGRTFYENISIDL